MRKALRNTRAATHGGDLTMPIQFEPRPSSVTRHIAILRLKPSENIEVLLLGEPIGVSVHYDRHEGGTFPCLGDECDRCPSRSYRRFYCPASREGKALRVL